MLLTAHEVVNDGVDGAVEIAEPVGDEGGGHRVIILRQFDCVSAPTHVQIITREIERERERTFKYYCATSCCELIKLIGRRNEI